jgi:hypothetical protein
MQKGVRAGSRAMACIPCPSGQKRMSCRHVSINPDDLILHLPQMLRLYVTASSHDDHHERIHVYVYAF